MIRTTTSRWPPRARRTAIAALCLAAGLGAALPAVPATEPARDPALEDRPELESDLLPDFGDSAGAYISPEQERLLGQSFMREMRRAAPIVVDEEVEDYIQKIGAEVGKYSGYYGDFHFFVVESSVINAFAVPGGYVGVHSGLILSSRNESELASVLAHEVSHLTQRHGARMIEAASRMSMPAMAAMLGAIVIAAMDPQAGMGALTVLTAAQQQYQINFTRANEKEADRIGIELLYEAGFDTTGMAAFFERLQLANRYTDPKQIPEYLRSHPVTVNRIAEARDRAERMGGTRLAREDSYDYQLVWHKLNVMGAPDPVQARNYYEIMLRDKTYKNEMAARYGYALALIEAGDFDRARAEIDGLLREAPGITAFQLAAARLEQQQGRLPAALARYADAQRKAPDSRAATYGYVALLNATGDAAKAKSLLRGFGDPENRDPRYYKLLAEAEERLGDLASSHYDLAEYYRAIGELEFAEEQLKLAQIAPGISHYQRLRVDARLEEVGKDLDRIDEDRRKEREREERRQQRR